VSLCEPYRQSNIFFLVGTGANTEFPTSMLCIWDDVKKEVVGSAQFKKPIVDLQVRGPWLLVAQDTLTTVLNFDKGINQENIIAEVQTESIKGKNLLTAILRESIHDNE